MSKNNVRIAIRDSTDSHNVAFFDNKAGIKYKSANLHRFLAGSASILTIKYNSKDIDSIRSGCKLAFRYKNRDYWLNVMSFEKKGYEVELTAYSLGLELNNETRGEHKPANAMSIAEYVAYYDPEHALTIGVNEVSDKRIKLEWTGTDTILARLFSVANSFDAELDFNVELNDDYSLKRQVLNIYKKGNLGTNKVSQPVRVGKELKVINYSDNIKELATSVRATGKDGLTIDGLNKKIYDSNKQLLYYSSGMTVYAPQSRDRFPSVGKGSNDNWIVKDLGETQYETKEALWGYMYGEIQKISVPEITYEVEGAIDAGIGDTQTLIDDIHFEPALYVQARVSELEDDILKGKVTNSTFINFERKYSQIADSLLKQVEALAEDAAPYIVRLSTDNGYNFKNGQGTSTITAKLEKYSKIVNAKWKWLINNSVVSETSSVKINASQVNGTLNVVAVAIVGGNEAAREYITFTNADDGVGVKSIMRYYTTNNQAEGVTVAGQNWSTKPTTVTADKKYMWSYDVITYTNDTSLVTKPAVIGARGEDGADVDPAVVDKINQSIADTKQQLSTVANDLDKSKADLQNAVSEVDTKATNLKADLTKAKQDLTGQAQQLASELTKRVSLVEETANGTKTTVSELSKTVDQNGKDITSVTARTKTVETDLTSTKTTLSQVKTAADNTSKKTATLEVGLNGLNAKFVNLNVGGTNLIKQSTGQKGLRLGPGADPISDANHTLTDWIKIEPSTVYTLTNFEDVDKDNRYYSLAWYITNSDDYRGWLSRPTGALQAADLKGGRQYTSPANAAYAKVSYPIDYPKVKLERGSVSTDYSQNEVDLEQKVAEYKQTADQNYASLQKTVQNLDGTVTANKATAEQTAAGFKTRIESLETYKDGETTRASQYFESAKTETARQLTAERTAIAKDYVAKSTYTSDVTGLRNDLTATTTTANTTKQNLASYQASNDKLVANLQSNLQATNGNVSSLKTKIEAVPGQISSAISTVEGKLEAIDQLNLIGAFNLTPQNATFDKTDYTLTSTTTTNTKDGFLQLQFFDTKNVIFATFNLSEKVGKFAKSFKITKAYERFRIKINGNVSDASVWCYDKDLLKLDTDYVLSGEVLSLSSDGRGNGGKIRYLKIQESKVATGFSKSPKDADSDISKVASEFKQTTDLIKASVSALDKSTVKSASLTINTDGIVMKAGKSTTDVANAIGSYFAVNQNAINLFADKIKVKGDMIVDGAITADKFKAARITSLNGATTFDLDSGNITFKKNLATINQVNGNYKSEVSLSSIKASIPAGDWSSVSTIAMDSTSFNTSKRRAGMRVDMMPTYSTTLITGETISFAGETESLGTVANSVSVTTEAAHLDVINKDTKGPSGQWNYPMIMDFGINAAIRVPDIKLGGYTKSLKGILNDLCRKAGILWT